ncbi:MAG: metal-dependent transcriptional regulator [Candidatus Methanoperedens sp.]|nr:metal-dependent transcriptional regulator [Candidatus Methanoperedens sp.]MCZ7369845.1 metal-dependent transcriptional regulator [Candidatus Methanoperedens sp.]
MGTDTPRIEEYLESIYKLQQEQHPVSTSRLAEHLKLSPPSVSEMVKKLASKDLVSHSEKGVCLTQEGNTIAKKVIRRHRLSERLLTDILGFKWDEVHDEACKLEHAISPEMEDRIAESLGNPRTCPHGHPIPDKNGKLTKEKVKPLSELRAAEKGIIVSVFEEDPKMLQYLASLGLIPDVCVKVEEVAPFGGPLIVCVGGSRYALGREVASKIKVK